jgi:subtilisin family serine protease
VVVLVVALWSAARSSAAGGSAIPWEVEPGRVILRGTAQARADAIAALESAQYIVADEGTIALFGMQKVQARLKGSALPAEPSLLLEVLGAARIPGLAEASANARLGIGGGQTGSLWVTRAVPWSESEFRAQYGAVAVASADDATRSTGRGVTIAVLDTGVRMNPSIEGQVLPRSIDFLATGESGVATEDPGGDGFDSDGDGAVDECVGHGTFVASVIALVAPEARQLHIRCVESDGLTTAFLLSQGVAAAIDAGADIVNISAMVPVSAGQLQEVAEAARRAGALLVVSAGNAFENTTTYPGGYPGALCVGSSGPADAFSNGFSTYGSHIDLCAPGESVVLAHAGDPEPVDGAVVLGAIGAEADGSPAFRAASGTSFSAAWASGVAALVRSGHAEWPDALVAPGQIAAELQSHLRATASPLASPVDIESLVGSGIVSSAGATAFLTPGSIPTLPLDVAANGTVAGAPIIDGADLAAMLSAWGPVGLGRISYADLDHSGVVDGGDLAALLSNWTVTP